MRGLIRFVRRDAHNVFANVISLVVCLGMVVVPSFYAWFNIAGSWDPYENTDQIRVALVNDDQGYKGDLIPVSVNMGERVVSKLNESTKIGYEVCSEDEATEGVRSGRYYAAIIIPADFSRSMLSALSPDASKPQITFLHNEKKNAIASIVTSKASASAQQTIDTTFSEAVTDVGSSVLGEIGSYLNDDQVLSFAARLDAAIDQGKGTLSQTSDTLRSFQSVSASSKALLDSSPQSLSRTLGSATSLGDALREGASGVRDASSAINGASRSAADALDEGSSDMDDVSAAIDSAFSDADGQVDKLTDGLGKAKGLVDERKAQLQQLVDDLEGTDALVKQIPLDHQLGPVDVDTVATITLELDGLNKRVGQELADVTALSEQLQKTIDDLQNSKTDASSAREELQQLVSDAKADLSSFRDGGASALRDSLGTLASSIDSSASAADSLTQALDGTLGDVQGTASETAASLDRLSNALGTAADELDGSVRQLDDLHDRLAAALSSGDIDTVRKILSANPSDLASFIASPVVMDRTAVYPVANNGSAMAPFYTTLAIWIGGVILCALVRATPSERGLEELKVRPGQSYLGRIAFFIVIGLLQATLILLGDLFFLNIQCVHPVLFVLAGWLASIVFVNVVYSLTASFGDVGKAIAVVLMVIQVAGSGGTFPPEMLPKPFRAVYPFLPFVHSEKAMRCAIAGLYGNDYWIALGKLAAFMIPALVLGLLLRKPVIRVNEWFERKLEETKVM